MGILKIFGGKVGFQNVSKNMQKICSLILEILRNVMNNRKIFIKKISKMPKKMFPKCFQNMQKICNMINGVIKINKG